MKKGFVTDIGKATLADTGFRHVLYTGKFSQLVLMSLKPEEEIGKDVHDTVEQFFRFEDDEDCVVIDGVRHAVRNGSAVVVPSGARHTVINVLAKSQLKLYTIYPPPEHIDRTHRKTKQEAIDRPEECTGKPDGKERYRKFPCASKRIPAAGGRQPSWPVTRQLSSPGPHIMHGLVRLGPADV